MKKYIALIMALVCMLCAAGCDKEEEKGQDYTNAAVLEVHDAYVLVECFDPTSGAVLAGTQAEVSLDVVLASGAPEISVGDKIRVVFTGVMETNPARFNTVFAVYLLDENGECILPE